jgi:hypothetical protein
MDHINQDDVLLAAEQLLEIRLDGWTQVAARREMRISSSGFIGRVTQASAP